MNVEGITLARSDSDLTKRAAAVAHDYPAGDELATFYADL